MINNLVGNAIKFTPNNGRVSVRLATRSSPSAVLANTLPLLLKVSDSGIGIHPDDIDRIFLKYSKATDARSADGVDRHGGAGLGLSISQAIVELHGGTISVHSDWGHGAAFSVKVDLPLVPVQPPSAANATAGQAASALNGCPPMLKSAVRGRRGRRCDRAARRE